MRDDHADLVAAYLGELRSRLRTPDADLVIAEAEDHLRESVAAGITIGMSELEAQEAAISAFGSVGAVVRAHNLRSGQVARDLVIAAMKLGWIGMFAVAASGFAAWAMDGLAGRPFVGGSPTAARFAPAQCDYWLKLWPGAHTCAQAAMLESSADAVSLRVIGGGIAGMALLGAYLLALMYWRPGGVRVLPRGFFPLAAAAVFAVGALALVVCTFTGAPFDAPAGPGSFLSGAVVALGMAVAYGVRARRLLRFRTALSAPPDGLLPGSEVGRVPLGEIAQPGPARVGQRRQLIRDFDFAAASGRADRNGHRAGKVAGGDAGVADPRAVLAAGHDPDGVLAVRAGLEHGARFGVVEGRDGKEGVPAMRPVLLAPGCEQQVRLARRQRHLDAPGEPHAAVGHGRSCSLCASAAVKFSP
jgi:hypothetical protein